MSLGKRMTMDVWSERGSVGISVTKTTDDPAGKLRLQIDSKTTPPCGPAQTGHIDIVLTAEEADFLRRALDS